MLDRRTPLRSNMPATPPPHTQSPKKRNPPPYPHTPPPSSNILPPPTPPLRPLRRLLVSSTSHRSAFGARRGLRPAHRLIATADNLGISSSRSNESSIDRPGRGLPRRFASSQSAAVAESLDATSALLLVNEVGVGGAGEKKAAGA